MSKRYALLTASNTFPLLGTDATLLGCTNDSAGHVARLLRGPWQKSGWDKGYDLREGNDNAENVRAKLDELIGLAKPGDIIAGPFNSSHGTHFTDRLTGQTVSCTVCHDSTWDKPGSFVSKLDYKRAFDKLKLGVKVFCLFDSCESGNIGESFKMLETFTSRNRWIEPPADIAKDLSEPVDVRLAPKQVWTIAGCEEKGTCADVHDSHPHGLFSDTFDKTVIASPNLTLTGLAKVLNSKMNGQKCVPNGPEWSFLQEN